MATKKKESSKSLLLGRYELGKLLGKGTFAKVYYARNVNTHQSVAIKVIEKDNILKGDMSGLIKREIAILRRIRHPNIVRLFEVMATKTKIFFVMEYVRGGELFHKIANERISGDLARKYFQQLISAIAHCHERGVYHRDLKLENILLDEKGDLKISDFGLGCIADETRKDSLFHTLCGTPAYIAPEVLASTKGYDPAMADIWSCGVILFILRAGYLPFNDENIMALYMKIYRGEFHCPAWFSPRLKQLVHELLNKDPEKRIKIPEIMTKKWFKQGFNHVELGLQDDDLLAVESDSDSHEKTWIGSGCLGKPQCLNAFDLISFSRGFDLSGLFEEREGGGEEGFRFVTSASVPKIMSKLEEIAKAASLTVRKKDYRVCMEGSGCRHGGAKEPLAIGAEIFELTPKLRVVEVKKKKKKGGDKIEYDEFCNRQLKPALQTLIAEEESP